MNRCLIAVLCALAVLPGWTGCRSGAGPAAPAAVAFANGRLTQPAPSADEIESPLRVAAAPSPRVVSAGEMPLPEAGAGQPRVQVMPPVQRGGHPAVIESVTLPNEDLHGYAFPGVGAELPPPPQSDLAREMWAEDAPADVSQPHRAEGPLPGAVPESPAPAAPAEEPVPVVAPVVEAAAPEPAPETPAPVVAPILAPIAPAPLPESTAAPAPAMNGWVGDAPVSPAPNLNRYEIGPGDVIEFQSFNDPLLSREATVRYDGYVSLPLIADLRVAGMTRDEAESAARAAYGRVFREPQLSLLVTESGSKTYTVVGDIATPGVYPYTRQTSLIDAISIAGGLRPRNTSSSVGGFVGITGQLTKAFVIRHADGGRHVLQYDLRGLGKPGAHASAAPIYYGDVIYVPEGVNLVYVLGESRNPVIVELTEGMTLLQLLSLSGGFNESTARLRSVVLIRQIDESESKVMLVNVRQMLRGAPDIRLNPGDIVYIPRKHMVRIQEFVQRFTGTLSPVLNLYTDAVNAYYAKDLAEALTREPEQSRTLQILGNIEQFGSSTQNIVDLYRRP